MPNYPRGLFGDGGGGGGIKTRTPADVFAGANRNAAEAARNAGLNAADLAEFDADPNLAIILRIAGTDTYQARRGGAWRDITNVVVGPAGPGASDAQVRAQVQAGVKAYARTGGPVVPEAEIDAAVMRDAELTQARILGLLNLTQQELDDLFVGARVTGSGASQSITITQNDGGTITLAVPDTGDGGGGGEGMADGVITGVGFSADGMTLTVTRSRGGNLTASIPASLRQAGLSQAQVQALIDAAEADDLDAAAVAAQIAAALRNYRQVPEVVSGAINQNITASGRGDTYRLTGANARTFFLPAASGGSPVPDGWETVIVNDSSAVLTVDADGADTIDGSSVRAVASGESIRVQKVAAGRWTVIADTDKGGESAGADATARASAAAAQQTADAANARANANTAEVRTARSETAANRAVVSRMSVFENYDLNPAGISGRDFPEFIGLTLSTKLTDKTITRLRVSMSGQIVANVQIPSDLTPFNNAVVNISGGVVNLTLNAAARQNLKNNLGTAPQFIEVSVDYTFSDGTSANDRLHFGTNNNAFDLSRNPDFSSDVTTLAAGTPSPVIIIANIASFDATQNRFEDSSGNEVTVPDGAIVTLTQAVYDAAVSDAEFTPNANAIFLTR